MHAANNIDILLVEDNPADIFLLKKMLNASSLQINSLYTTDKVFPSWIYEPVSLKILEVNHAAIFMLTTSLNPDDELKAEGIEEVNGYKNKPLTKQILEEIIRQYF